MDDKKIRFRKLAVRTATGIAAVAFTTPAPAEPPCLSCAIGTTTSDTRFGALAPAVNSRRHRLEAAGRPAGGRNEMRGAQPNPFALGVAGRHLAAVAPAKVRRFVLDMGVRSLGLATYRAKTAGNDPAGLAIPHDRFALWGGDIRLAQELGQRDGIALSLSFEGEKRRPLFGPNVTRRFRSSAYGASLNWTHGDGFALSAGYRTLQSRGRSNPAERLFDLAAAAPADARGFHLTATARPLARAGNDLTISADLRSERLSAFDASAFGGNGRRRNMGLAVVVRAPF